MSLYSENYAHSVEVWQDGELVGGLYGLALGQVFFGESMFSHVADASKVALAYLCEHLNTKGFELIDCQVESQHLLSLGAKNIPRDDFVGYLSCIDIQQPMTDFSTNFPSCLKK